MIPIGTRIHGSHGDGTIVGYNNVQQYDYLQNERAGMTLAEMPTSILSAIVNSAYDGQRYPYVVRFDNGYQDVYAEREIVPVD